MIIKTTHKMATSLIIISSLMALPNISYSKEVKNEDFLAKLLSSFTSKNEIPKTTQIFEADIKSIKLTSIDDFEFSTFVKFPFSSSASVLPLPFLPVPHSPRPIRCTCRALVMPRHRHHPRGHAFL